MRTSYNKIVNYNPDAKEIIVLDEVFQHSDNFKGATGSIFVAVSEGEIQETIGEYEDEPMELLKYMAENGFEINSEFIDSLDASRDALIELFFDLSYSDKWEDMRQELGLSENEAVIFNCIGGGRCFDKDFQGNINPELSEIIREYEQ